MSRSRIFLGLAAVVLLVATASLAHAQNTSELERRVGPLVLGGNWNPNGVPVLWRHRHHRQ